MFKLTKAGRQTLFNTANKGINIDFHTLTLGTGRYVSSDHDTRTALVTPIISATLSVRSVNDKQMQLTASVRHSSGLEVYEIGLFTQSGVLIAIASSSTTPLCVLPANEPQTLNLAVSV